MPQAQHTAPDSITPVAPREGVELVVNDEHYLHTGDPDMPLMWYLRDVLRLTGCKYGCDTGGCGACTVLVDGNATHACGQAMRKLEGRRVMTVEGLAPGDTELHALQKAWITEDAILCGYCQPGWLMAAAGLLARTSDPTDADIDQLPNLCRCGSQPRVRAAIKRAAQDMHEKDPA